MASKQISIEQFFEIDLKVAKILTVDRVENADRLYRLMVDLGGEKRQLVAGIAQAYEAEKLIGKLIAVVTNLEPATIRGVESQGMLLAADLGGRPILATFEEDIPPGTKIH